MGPFGNAALGTAALISFLMTLILFGLDLVPLKSGDRRGRLPPFARMAIGSCISAAIVFVLLVCMNFLIFFFGTPALTGPFGGWFFVAGDLALAVVIFGFHAWVQNRLSLGNALGLAVVLISAIAGCSMVAFNPGSEGGAKTLAHIVHVEVMPQDAIYPDTDADHILLVPEQTALFKAQQVIAKNPDGAGQNLSTIYKPECGVLQSINSHLYWICELRFAGFRVSNQVKRIVPGYIVVDAENPDAEARMNLGYKMKYTPGSPLNTSLKRLVYNSGYEHRLIGEFELEIRDGDWKPFYTASLNDRALRFKGSVPRTMIIIDPETGKIEEHNLDDIPVWVDRVYSKPVVHEFLEWWGHWNQAPWKCCNETSAGRMKPAGEPNLVYTKGGHPAWQVLMTSWNSDTSVTGVILFDGRSNTARLYNISGIGIESAALHSFLTSKATVKNLRPVHPSLHKIYGELTWVVAYISPGEFTTTPEAFQGVGLLSANDLSGANVVFGERKDKAFLEYRQLLARGSSNKAPEEGRLDKRVEGVVVDVATAVIDGNTNYFLILDSDPVRRFKGVIWVSDTLPFVKVGSHVTIGYLDVGKETVDISSYEDLSMRRAPSS